MMMNSKLPTDVLGKIWDLSDMDRDGSLDRAEFNIVSVLCIVAYIHKHQPHIDVSYGNESIPRRSPFSGHQLDYAMKILALYSKKTEDFMSFYTIYRGIMQRYFNNNSVLRGLAYFLIGSDRESRSYPGPGFQLPGRW